MSDVSRITGFSDAVFGFALTLLVVSTAVPETFDDLRAILQGFPAFAATFATICWIWYEHALFFRRYPIDDGFTVLLNSLLLFVVMFYAYPLKFVFTRLIGGWLLGIGPTIGDGMTGADAQLVMVVYSAGFGALFAIFGLLHWHALRQRETLRLDRMSVYDAQASFSRHMINVSVAAVSVLLAMVLPRSQLAFAGLIFFLLAPLHAMYGYYNGRRRARLEVAR